MSDEHTRARAQSVPIEKSRALPAQPNIDRLKNEAKKRLDALRDTTPNAKLSDAQFEIAREYGFASWRALKDAVEDLGTSDIDKDAPVEACAGNYRYGPGMVDNTYSVITCDEGQLYIGGEAPDTKAPLVRQASGWFAVPGVSYRYGFADIKNGHAQVMYLRTKIRRRVMSRIDTEITAKIKAAQDAALEDQQRPRTEVAIEPDLLVRYTGHYASRFGYAMHVTREGARLFFQVYNQGRSELFAESETKFFVRYGPLQVSFAVEEDRCNAAILHYAGTLQHFFRVSAERAQEASRTVSERLKAQLEPRTIAAVDPALFARYVGNYRVGKDKVNTITLEDGQLYSQITDQARFAVYPESESKFFHTVAAAQISFFAGPDGRITHAVQYQNGREIIMSRLGDAS